MNLVNAFLEYVELLKQRWRALKKGTPLFIPFPPTMERLSRLVPGLIKEESWLVTAQTGVGKSKFVRYLFINWPIKYVQANPNIKLTIVYNTLEETRSEIITGFIIEHVLESTGIRITSYQANGYVEVSHKVKKAILNAKKRFEELDPYLIITNEYNPTGLYKKAREIATTAGKFYKDDKEVTPEDVLAGKGWNKYVDDPNHYVIMIHDRLLLFSEERKNKKVMNHYDTIMNWMDYYVRQILNKQFKFIVVNVQQQIPSGENKQYTSKGELVEERLEPSLDKLNRVKATQQAATIILGLFAPHKYGLRKRFESTYPGYDIARLLNNYREVLLLKHRKGFDAQILPFYFDGAAEVWEDMPAPNDQKGINKIYERIKNNEKNDVEKDPQLNIDFNFMKLNTN